MMTAIHSNISTSINSVLAYCESNHVDVWGITSAIAVGLCIGTVTVVFLATYPGQPLGIYDDIETTDATTDRKLSSRGDAVPTEELDAIPGISNEQIYQIIQATQHQHQLKIKAYNKNIDSELTISAFTMIKILILTGLLASLVYILNRDYNNVVTIWFVRTFPRESSTFGLSLKNEL